MHAQLVRAACTLPALQAPLLPLLVSFLGAYCWSDARQASWLASIIPDVVDAVQSTEGSTGLVLCRSDPLCCFVLCFCPGVAWGREGWGALEGTCESVLWTASYGRERV